MRTECFGCVEINSKDRMTMHECNSIRPHYCRTCLCRPHVRRPQANKIDTCWMYWETLSIQSNEMGRTYRTEVNIVTDILNALVDLLVPAFRRHRLASRATEEEEENRVRIKTRTRVRNSRMKSYSCELANARVIAHGSEIGRRRCMHTIFT